MKIIGLMLARNEEWILKASLPIALEWCNEIVFMNHASTDATKSIVMDSPRSGSITYMESNDRGQWSEMDLRQQMLEIGRERGGTHFAMIDADEIPTLNVLPKLRRWAGSLKKGQVLELPMIAPWRGLDKYRDDDSVWSKAFISTVFFDKSDMRWANREDGYCHHARVPANAAERIAPLKDKSEGGVMHLQWVNWKRLLAKQKLYAVNEMLRWPDRKTAKQVSDMYSQASNEDDIKLSPIPREWLTYSELEFINLSDEPWQESELERLVTLHGSEKFKGLEILTREAIL